MPGLKNGLVILLLLIAAHALIFVECSSFIVTQTEVFVSLKPTILFIPDTIEVKMCFVCKPDAPNIIFIKTNHCKHRACKTKTLLHSCIEYGFVSLNFVWKYLIIYFVLECFKPVSTVILQSDFLEFFKQFSKLWLNF